MIERGVSVISQASVCLPQLLTILFSARRRLAVASASELSKVSPTSLLQRGQRALIFSHLSTQSLWNRWVHGNSLTSSLFAYFAKQMQQTWKKWGIKTLKNQIWVIKQLPSQTSHTIKFDTKTRRFLLYFVISVLVGLSLKVEEHLPKQSILTRFLQQYHDCKWLLANIRARYILISFVYNWSSEVTTILLFLVILYFIILVMFPFMYFHAI